MLLTMLFYLSVTVVPNLYGQEDKARGVNSKAKKYKTAPLQHRYLLENLFDGLCATGDFAWSLGMVSIHSTQQSEYVRLSDDMSVDDTHVPQAGVDYTWEGDVIPSYKQFISPLREPTPGTTSHTPVCQVGVRTQSKRKKSAAAVQPLELTELVQSLISVFTAQGVSTTSTNNYDTTSEVLKVLKDMVNSYEMDNVLYSKSLKFL
ncbi:hypothetical protein GIB67_012306 [Kingdonia uniflora]|uniref:Uncharacterized protein n=1 Tax=Kingdonia uniflora TaxID=39325 RepID=A0A7J7MVD0_9MAGN|nr:hypothetical protein GIB67_012306 [Kingdonia uniflora]